MSDTFKVGEVAIGCNFKVDVSRNGLECTIIASLTWYDRVRIKDTNQYDVGWHYTVRWADGDVNRADPTQLRRKPPADEGHTVTRWADCPWQPEKVRV